MWDVARLVAHQDLETISQLKITLSQSPSLRYLAHSATLDMNIGTIYLLSEVYLFVNILPP